MQIEENKRLFKAPQLSEKAQADSDAEPNKDDIISLDDVSCDSQELKKRELIASKIKQKI